MSRSMDIDGLAERIRELILRGANDEAVRLAEELAEAEPRPQKALLALSWAFSLGDDPDRAAAYAEEAARRYPADLQSWIALTEARLASGDVLGAESAAQRAAGIDPSVAHCKALHAVIARLKDGCGPPLDGPCGDILRKTRESLQKRFAGLCGGGRYGQAFRIAEDLLVPGQREWNCLDVLRYPWGPGASHEKHLALLRRGRLESRLRPWRSCYEFILSASGSPAVEMERLSRAIRSLPFERYGWMRYVLIRHELRCGRRDLAGLIQELRGVLERWEADHQSRCLLAELLIADGKGEEGAAEFERARSLCPARRRQIDDWEREARSHPRGERGGGPAFTVRGRGSRITTADGRSYIDYKLSGGPLILGYARRGTAKASWDGSERRLAEEIRAAFPSMESVRLTSSGSGAAAGALRACRAFTRRESVVTFAGCFHGDSDDFKNTLQVPYNDSPGVRRLFRRAGRSIAAVIVEPIAANMGVVPPAEGFLQALRELTERFGSLLVFDEIITGFRLLYGGAQAAVGVRPDLTCLGKIIGGGFPIGVYGGRKDVMALAGREAGRDIAEAAAAGAAVLRALKREDPYGRMERLTGRLARGIGELAAASGRAVQVNRRGSMFTVFFTEKPVRDLASAEAADARLYERFFRALLEEGVHFPPGHLEAAYLSARHTDADVKHTLSAAASAFRRL